MPLIHQKYNIFLNLSITGYFAKQGIKIIPNIRFGIDATFDDFANAIPRNTFIALGNYGFIKTNKEKNLWFEITIRVIETIKPKGIIIYGSIFEEMKNLFILYGIEYLVYEPVIKEDYLKFKK